MQPYTVKRIYTARFRVCIRLQYNIVYIYVGVYIRSYGTHILNYTPTLPDMHYYCFFLIGILHRLIQCHMFFITAFQASSHCFSCPVLSRDAACLTFNPRVYSAISPFYHESRLGLDYSRHLFGAHVRRPIGVEDCLHFITFTTHYGTFFCWQDDIVSVARLMADCFDHFQSGEDPALCALTGRTIAAGLARRQEQM
jgi:hypothetical protein